MVEQSVVWNGIHVTMKEGRTIPGCFKCPACDGKHRAHTCERARKRAPAAPGFALGWDMMPTGLGHDVAGVRHPTKKKARAGCGTYGAPPLVLLAHDVVEQCRERELAERRAEAVAQRAELHSKWSREKAAALREARSQWTEHAWPCTAGCTSERCLALQADERAVVQSALNARRQQLASQAAAEASAEAEVRSRYAEILGRYSGGVAAAAATWNRCVGHAGATSLDAKCWPEPQPVHRSQCTPRAQGTTQAAALSVVQMAAVRELLPVRRPPCLPPVRPGVGCGGRRRPARLLPLRRAPRPVPGLLAEAGAALRALRGALLPVCVWHARTCTPCMCMMCILSCAWHVHGMCIHRSCFEDHHAWCAWRHRDCCGLVKGRSAQKRFAAGHCRQPRAHGERYRKCGACGTLSCEACLRDFGSTGVRCQECAEAA